MVNQADNERYLKAFALHLVGESEKPLEFYPPTYQQIALLLDGSIEKKENVFIPFNQPCIWGPKSKELEEVVWTFSHMPDLIEMEQCGAPIGLGRIISAQEEPYDFYISIPPRSGPVLSIVYIAYGLTIHIPLETKKYLSNKVQGKKNLPDEYLRAEKELEEKFLGKTGLEDMNNLIYELNNTPTKEVYEWARDSYQKMQSGVTQNTLNISTVLNPE